MSTSFFVPQEGTLPLYEQIYRRMVEEIRSGRLAAGERAPSKRQLCAQLGVSLSTVETAYGMLVAEGYLQSQPRSGYRVCSLLPLDAPAASVPQSPVPAPVPAAPALSDVFSTAAVDTHIFPSSVWASLTREALKDPELLQRGDPQGDLPLREALCDFLRSCRGVRCRSEQVVVGAGMEYLLSVLFQLFDPAVPVALEEPGYNAAYRTLENLGRSAVPVPVDRQGMVPDALAASGAGVAYVTPSHQFPTGAAMPAGRRTELLRWAYAAPHRYLIEDDYDSEFRYASRPIPAMQGMDTGGRVVYTGTFSRTLAPSIRAAYLILPEALLEVYKARFAHGASTVSRFEQQVLCRFLSSGQYGRHLRRAGSLYRARCAALTAALKDAFPQGRVSGAGAGLHLLLSLPGRDERELAARAAAAGYRVRTLGEYCRGTSPLPGSLVLGFAGLDVSAAPRAVADLARAFGGM